MPRSAGAGPLTAARSSPAAMAAAPRPIPQHEEQFHDAEESYEADHEERPDEEHEEHAHEHHDAPTDEVEEDAEHAHHYQLAPMHSQAQPQRSPPHRVPKPSSVQVQSESQWHVTPSGARRTHSGASTTLASPDADQLSGVRTVPSTPPIGATAAAAGGAAAAATVGPDGVLVQPPKRLLDAGLIALKTNLKPGLALQAIALLIIIIYYSSDSAQESFNALAEFKSDAGYAFSGISTAIFGGLIPWLILQAKKELDRRKREKAASMVAGLDLSQAPPVEGATHILVNDEPLTTLALDAQMHEESLASSGSGTDAVAGGAITSPSAPPAPWAECLFLTVFWGLKGMEVDAFYRLQGLIWGNDSEFGTIFGKVITDQFLYNPTWASPSVLAAYTWKDCNFNFARWWPMIACRHFWMWRVPENLVSAWMVWIPAVSMIYMLPGSLQIPLFNIVLCFWSLVLALITAS